MSSLESQENNNTAEVTPPLENLSKDVNKTINTIKTINTNKTITPTIKKNLKALQEKTPEIKTSAKNPDNNISKEVTDTIGALAIVAGANEKNITTIKKIINKDSAIGNFLSKMWSAIKPFIPNFILNLLKETDNKIGNDTKTKTIPPIPTPPNDTGTTKEIDEVKNLPQLETTKTFIEKKFTKLLTGPTRFKEDINKMFAGSEGIRLYPSPKTYKQLQSVLRLKSAETVHGGDTEKSPTHKGTYIIMRALEGKFPDMFTYSAAVNDDFHHDKISYHSKHTDGLAFDYSLKNPKSHKTSFKKIKEYLSELGLDTSGLINEYKKLSKSGTGGHFHFSFKKSELDQVYEACSSHIGSTKDKKK